MDKNNIFLIIWLILLLASCRSHKVQFELQKLWQIGSNEKESSYFFAFIADGITDEKGNLWVVDMKQGLVKKFDKNGEFKKSFGGRGNGPGELASPNSIFIKDDKVYIRELFGEIEVYDTSGKYIKTLKVPPGNFILLTEDKKILTNVQGKKENFIFIFSENGEKLDSFGVSRTLPALLKKILKIEHDFVRRACIYDNYLFAGFGFQYLIHIYDLKTKRLIKELKRKIEYPTELKPRLRPFSTIFIFSDDKYIYYSYVINKKDSSYYYLDIWSRNSKYLNTVKLPGQLITIDKKKNLYIEIFTPYIKIYKFRLIEKK